MSVKLDALFKSEVHAKIISFFNENPASVDTPRGIAVWTGFNRTVAKKALDDLVEAGVLIAHPASSTTGYSYTNNMKIIRAVEKRIKLLEKLGGWE